MSYTGNEIEHISSALSSDNPNQCRIAEIGLEWLCMLLDRNTDYGEPVLAPTLSPGDAILVRMSDKIRRLRNLLASDEPSVLDESIEDAMGDLGFHALLWLTRPEGER